MLKVVAYLTKLIPLIILAVRTVEEASDGWTSEEKRNAAIEMVRVASEQFGFSLPEGALEAIGKVIDALVAALNVIGKFGKQA